MLKKLVTKRKRIAVSARSAARSDESYLRMYSRDSDRHAANDPQEAVGGMWEEMGRLQSEFLKSEGLRPPHTLLDIGCGSLRAGLHFVRYLDPGKYTGFDMSPKLLAAGRTYLEGEGLTAKSPTLIQTSGSLDFSFVDGKYDFLLAQSVFTHLRRRTIEQCFANLGKVMHRSSAFYFTFFEADDHVEAGQLTFRQPFGFYEELAATHAMTLQRHPDYDAQHPRGQKMLSMRPVTTIPDQIGECPGEP